MPPARRERPESSGAEARQERDGADPLGHPHRGVALVPREGLVAAVSGERDRDVAARDLRDQERGQDGLVAERLVEE